MTVLDEERCRTLVEKLCSGLGWHVRPAPGARIVLCDRKGRWLTFGQSISDVVESLCDLRHWTGIADACGLPAWLRECSSPEELELKTEVAL